MKSVLIADDSAVVRKSLCLMFERAGWVVVSEATTGKEAVERAIEFNPNIIVLDLSMPVMNGLAAALILKESAPHTPVILFTSFGSMVKSADLERAGFAASIGKDDAGKLLSTAECLFTDPKFVVNSH